MLLIDPLHREIRQSHWDNAGIWKTNGRGPDKLCIEGKVTVSGDECNRADKEKMVQKMEGFV